MLSCYLHSICHICSLFLCFSFFVSIGMIKNFSLLLMSLAVAVEIATCILHILRSITFITTSTMQEASYSLTISSLFCVITIFIISIYICNLLTHRIVLLLFETSTVDIYLHYLCAPVVFLFAFPHFHLGSVSVCLMNFFYCF